MAFKVTTVLAVFAVLLLVQSAVGVRQLQTNPGSDCTSGPVLNAGPLKETSCGDCPSVLKQAQVCPHDGQWYTFCMIGDAAGGCRLQSKGNFPESACNTECGFNSKHM